LCFLDHTELQYLFRIVQLRHLDVDDIHTARHREAVVVQEIPVGKLRSVILVKRADERSGYGVNPDMRNLRQMIECHKTLIFVQFLRIRADVRIRES
jgi:hypothetical protein